MANIIKAVLGRARGAVGDVTFREKNGKSFVGVRPGSFIPGKDAKSVARRAKFSLAVKIGAAVYSAAYLKKLWEVYGPDTLSAFNAIVSANYKSIGSENLSGFVKLVPDLGFSVDNPAAAVNQSDVTITADALTGSSGIDTNIEKSVAAVSLYYFSDPLEESSAKYSVITLVSEEEQLVLDTPFSFTSPLSDTGVQLMGMYSSHRGFHALVTLDQTGIPVRFSSAFEA